MSKSIPTRLATLINLLVILTLAFPWSARAVAPRQAGETPVESFRTTVRLEHAADLARLEQLGVTVLASWSDRASVLVTGSQLETLARLRFQPASSDALESLLQSAAANGSETAGQVLAGLQRQPAAVEGVFAALTPLQKIALSGLPGLDADNDDLTDTEEGWWCTNPLNANSDGDARGYTDGQEIHALLDYTLSRAMRKEYGPPFGPPNPWPDFNGADGDPNTPACYDGDYDTIPDQAEAYMVGTRVPVESTDGDKFDDGQELFGLTYCPGGVTSCGYGSYPRIEYWNYIKAEMPNWVLPPGDNPFVAAFPVPEVAVLPGSWTVERVTTITTQEGQMTQASHSYETAVTRGQSTSIADTVTWNNWEEISKATETPLRVSKAPNVPVIAIAGVIIAGAAAGAAIWSAVSDHKQASAPDYGPDIVQKLGKIGEYTSDIAKGVTIAGDRLQSINSTLEDSFKGINTSLDGIHYVLDEQNKILAYGLQDISYQISRPRFTETRTNGKSWGGAQTVTNEEYEEHTVSEGQAFTSGENWSTAWAADSSHAADLTFSYVISNTGTEYARELTGLVFNIYLGDDATPLVSYPAWEQFPGGKLENIFPGDSHTFTANRAPLSLEQMKRIDLGEHLRVVLESYSYGADELFYKDAANGGVTVYIEDGVEDGDEAVDMYVIPTWGMESVQDVLTRYFPHGQDAEGYLNALWTPEFDGIQPAEWNEHYLSDISWWNIYLTQENGGSTPLNQLQAAAGSAVLFRFNRDSDRDGYKDSVEVRYYCALPPADPERQYCGTAQERPEIHPQPEILAGYTAKRSGNNVTALLKVANFGTFDAYGIDAVMFTLDDSVTIKNNTVGGNGRARPGQQIAVGSLVLLEDTDLANWKNSKAHPYAGGQFSGDVDKIFTFTVHTAGVVGQGDAAMSWRSSTGLTGTLALGGNYHAPLPIDIAEGLQVGFDTGTLVPGESFTVRALTPRDTFQYTINRQPYTPPVIVVSYSDPQGSRRFITPVQLSSLQDDLTPYRGQMLPDAGLSIVGMGAFTATVANTTAFILNNPYTQTVEDAHLYLDFVQDGTPVAHLPYTLDVPPGPTVYPVTWNTNAFTQPFNASAEHLMIAFWTDQQDNIIDSAARPLESLDKDPTPEAALQTNAWNFGSVPLGTMLSKEFALFNTGFASLNAFAHANDLSITPRSLTVAPGGFQTFTVVLDTANLSVGPYNRALSIPTNDGYRPEVNINIQGIVTALPGQALSQGLDKYRPWNQTVYVPGPKSQNDTITFGQTISTDAERMHPLYVYSRDGGTLLGIGEYGPDFTGQTAPFGIFGDGRDGPLTVGAGQTVYLDDTNPATSISGIVASGQNALPVIDTSGFFDGDKIMIHQTRGTGAGMWEMADVVSVGASQLILEKNLNHNYTDGGNDQSQVIRVQQYTDCSIDTGGILTAVGWNGDVGGIIVFLCNHKAIINGTIIANGLGYRGGAPNFKDTGNQGEGINGQGLQSNGENGNGGGGGMGGSPSNSPAGNGGGGGNGTSGESGDSRSGTPGGNGGIVAGNNELSLLQFGGAGGAGGGDENETALRGGVGGNGGGIVILFAREITFTGNLEANGGKGQNGQGNYSAGGGGGAGGSVFIKANNANLGSGSLVTIGGLGGVQDQDNKHGGDGGVGRIRIESCNSLTVSTTPPASIQQMTCFITRQLPGSPNTELILPEAIASYTRYRLQYGQRGIFTSPSSTQVYSITIPKRTYASASLDALFENLATAPFTFSLDIGANGTIDWTNSGSEQPVLLSSSNLAARLNAYLGATPEAWGADVVVPISVSLSTSGDVFLTNFAAVPRISDSDLRLQAGYLTASKTSPRETEVITLTAMVRNPGPAPAENVIASFFAGDPAAGGLYLGSDYAAAIPAGGSVSLRRTFDTTGYTGTLSVYAVVDPLNQVNELDENNNTTSKELTINIRPDLLLESATPLAGEAPAGQVQAFDLLVRNNGQAVGSNVRMDLTEGEGVTRTLKSYALVSVTGKTVVTATLYYTASNTLGLHPLKVTADGYNLIKESDETNNTIPVQVYTGWNAPVYVDAGSVTDTLYTASKGYGYLNAGTTGSCGSLPAQTYRQAPSGEALQYRIDHLLASHSYHLDLTFLACSDPRSLRVLVDGVEVAGAVSAGPTANTLSLRLDPGLYADHSIIISIEKTGNEPGGALLSELKLSDVYYCYRDSGADDEAAYTAANGCGYLDGQADQTWGSQPYQSARLDPTDASLRYRFDRLDPAKAYRVWLTFYQPSGEPRQQKVDIDGLQTGLQVDTSDGQVHRLSAMVPRNAYASNGMIVVEIRRTNGASGPLVNEIALEEETNPAAASCAMVQPTMSFSEASGTLKLYSSSAPAGAVVQAVNPRGEVVGCQAIASAGQYNLLRIYGEDNSVQPPVPGMRPGERVAFVIYDGVSAVASPAFYWQDDKTFHTANLEAKYLTQQPLALKGGWNLVGLNVAPPNPQPAILLGALRNRVSPIIGESVSWSKDITDTFNSLKEIQPYQGYYLYLHGGENTNWLVGGETIANNVSVPLKAGWNWIAGPAIAHPVAAALSSIAGSYQKVMSLEQTYIVTMPTTSTLKAMEPGKGYLLYATAPVTLTYPLLLEAAEPGAVVEEETSACPGLAPTPRLTLVYGQVSINGAPAPAGSKLEILTPRGELAGCALLQEGGLLLLTHVYGADELGTPGFLPGEALFFRLDGLPLAPSQPLTWADDREPHQLDLQAAAVRLYLPYAVK